MISKNGKTHDFRIFKESKVHFKIDTLMMTDSAYQGIQKIHANSIVPKKKSKNKPLTKEDKANNKNISSMRVLNENIIGLIKRFKIVSDRYRNRRKRFGLRFTLISGIYNFELSV